MGDAALGASRLADVLDALGSDQPAPGGGAASAVAAALGAALIEMVCRFSAGREAYAAHQAQIIAALDAAVAARHELLGVADADADAFQRVAAALALPRGSRGQRSARRAALDDALAAAAGPPLQVMAAAAQLIPLARDLVGRTNPTVVSDLGAAGELLAGALRAAAFSAAANADALKEDVRASTLREQAGAATSSAEAALAGLRAALNRRPIDAG